MHLSFSFFITSLLLGLGLAMDAFSVSLANGLNEPCMRRKKICAIAGIFALFQCAMPMLGWVFVTTLAHFFSAFEKCIPYIALALLSFIGGKMLYEGIKNKEEFSCTCEEKIGIWGLIVQGIATSIDALSVGFTIASYNLFESLLSCGIIGAVTFALCYIGVIIGKKAGTHLAGKAGIFGGVILIFIGIEIFLTGIL